MSFPLTSLGIEGGTSIQPEVRDQITTIFITTPQSLNHGDIIHIVVDGQLVHAHRWDDDTRY